MWIRLIFIASLFLCGCETLNTLETPKYAARIENLDMPLQLLQRYAAAACPAGFRNTSANGRTFHSNNFIMSNGKAKEAGEALSRYVAHIAVLGSERPYAIEVVIDKEERVLQGEEFVYAVTSHNERLAKELASRIHEALTKRREDRNIIDDFRAF